MEKVIIDEHDVEIGQYILSLFKTRLDIVTSWGLDPETLRPIKTGIQFHVQGFKHTGPVRVMLNEGADLFEVTLLSEAGEVVKHIEDVFLDTLISTIDEAVEKTDDYDKKLCDTYPFLTDPDNPEKLKPIEIIIL